jgi:hypothetical protein
MSERKSTGPILPSLLAGAIKLFWKGPEIQTIGFDGELRSSACCIEDAAATVVLAWFRGGHNASDHEALTAELEEAGDLGFIVSAWEIIFSPLAARTIAWIIIQMEADETIDAENWDRYANRITLEAKPDAAG